jgi:small GTP-binding protein
MYKTPASNRLHIGIFGKRNTGKSSLINAITGQDTAIVSDIAGTTTDPVSKAMEILPIGPCILIDTAGIDDRGILGEERVKKTQRVLRKTDVGIIVVEPDTIIDNFEEEIVESFRSKKLPFIFVLNKCEFKGKASRGYLLKNKIPFIEVSAKLNKGIDELKKKIMDLARYLWSRILLMKKML